jgi:Arc/MetJ family transcription regulator
MKRVTIELDDATLAWVTTLGINRGQSTSRVVNDLLQRLLPNGDAYEIAMSQFLARAPQPFNSLGVPLPSRAEINKRRK